MNQLVLINVSKRQIWRNMLFIVQAHYLFYCFVCFVRVLVLKQKLRHFLFVSTTDTPYKASLFCLKVGIDGSFGKGVGKTNDSKNLCQFKC